MTLIKINFMPYIVLRKAKYCHLVLLGNAKQSKFCICGGYCDMIERAYNLLLLLGHDGRLSKFTALKSTPKVSQHNPQLNYRI